MRSRICSITAGGHLSFTFHVISRFGSTVRSRVKGRRLRIDQKDKGSNLDLSHYKSVLYQTNSLLFYILNRVIKSVKNRSALITHQLANEWKITS
jgi:hypothetical protein